MCYCHHRVMCFTHVVGTMIKEASALPYQINLRNILSNDLKNTRDVGTIS